METEAAGWVTGAAPAGSAAPQSSPSDHGHTSDAPSAATRGSAVPPDPDASRGRDASEAQPRLALVPGDTVLSAGDTLVVRVSLIDGREISGVPFHLLFNPEVLEFVGTREGSVFRSTAEAPLLLAGVNPNRPGDLAVGLAMISSAEPPSISGDILEIEFRAVGSGESDLVFDRASVRGAHGETVSADFLSSTVTVR